MAERVIWMMSLTISTCITILSAAAERPELHLLVTAGVTLAIAIVAVQADRKLRAAGANQSAIAASNARYMGLIWIWAACALLFTYEFILTWRESWSFTVGLMLVGALCLGLAWMFDKDAAADKDDATLLKFGRTLNWVQSTGMLLVVAGLILDNKFSPLSTRGLREDWAANNVFFFGAISVALIGAQALIADQRRMRAKT